MICCKGRTLLLQIAVSFLCIHLSFAAVDAQVDVKPVAFLPGVSQSVQMICRPPSAEDISQVMTMQLEKERDLSSGQDPVVSFVTSGSPVVETFGINLGVSASGTVYDVHNPKAAALVVTFTNPTEAADGRYTCSVETLDSHGLLHRYLGHISLVSLSKNGTVPVFYQAILQEMRVDLDNLTSDLTTVQRLHSDLTKGDNAEQAMLSAMDTNSGQISTMISEVNGLVSAADHLVTTMEADIARLRDITPETPVHFYAYYSGSAYNAAGNVVFDNLQETTPDKAYSTSTHVFTAPVNGTYFFRTGVTGNSDPTSASILVNNVALASLYTYDDYDVKQATACLVVALAVNDTVRVERESGTNVYGYYASSAYTHHTYFMGLLLW